MLVVGTLNRQKGRELTDLFASVGLELKSLADFPDSIEIVEDGQTFAENAALKATGHASASANGFWPTIAAWPSTLWEVLPEFALPDTRVPAPQTNRTTAFLSRNWRA